MGTAGSEDPRTSLALERTSFAKYRTQLALDRTTLAWLRTALTFATFGFGIVGFFRTMDQSSQTPQSARLHHAAIHMGVTLILIGIISMLLSGTAHLFALRKLQRGETLPLAKWPLTVTIAALVSFLGLYGLWSLFYG